MTKFFDNLILFICFWEWPKPPTEQEIKDLAWARQMLKNCR